MNNALQRNVYIRSQDSDGFGVKQIVYSGGYVMHNRVSDWDDYLKRELNMLCSLPDDWDGYNSPAVKFENAELALHLLSSLKQIIDDSGPQISCLIPSSPFLVPVSGGALQAEWHLGEHFVELFFDSSEPVKATYYVSGIDNEEELDIEFENQQTNLADLVSWFKKINEANNAQPATA